MKSVGVLSGWSSPSGKRVFDRQERVSRCYAVPLGCWTGGVTEGLMGLCTWHHRVIEDVCNMHRVSAPQAGVAFPATVSVLWGCVSKH